MICRDPFTILTDYEKAQFLFPFCECCEFCNQCELCNDYIAKRVRRNPVSVKMVRRRKKTKKIPPVRISKPPDPAPTYITEQDAWENGDCAMSVRKCYQIECGDKWVSDGIGDHYEIDLEYDYKKGIYKIVKNTTDKWEPRQPVFISSQTGGGKNTFIEEEIIPYVRELNLKHNTDFKVLYLVNRKALQAQINDRLDGKDDPDFEKDGLYYGQYKDYVCADAISYQSFLNKADYLKKKQKTNSGYLFVVCDEAHFFPSDGMFNPDTSKILEAIVKTFTNAVRIYMTATPYEGLKYISEYEHRYNDNSRLGVLYHFKRNYNYLRIKYFSHINELKDIIVESVTNKNEKWLVFIDDKEKCENYKNILESYDGETIDEDDAEDGDNNSNTDTNKTSGGPMDGKVFAVNAESKYNEKYQKMIVDERLGKKTNVLVTTSVLDNGVNLRDIDNVVITDINKTKCLQMLGRARADRDENGKYKKKITLYVQRASPKYIEKRIKDLERRRDAYHSYDLAYGNAVDFNEKRNKREYEQEFLEKYYHDDPVDWENGVHWFGIDAINPPTLFSSKYYFNNIARSVVNRLIPRYTSILEEMKATDKSRKVTGQKYLEYQLSWFGKKYNRKNDITLNGYKNDGQLNFEKWLRENWLDKEMPKDELTDFRKRFYYKYHCIFGYCSKAQGFSSDDNRTEKGPKNAGYSIPRIREIFQVRKMPFEIIDNDGCYIIRKKSDESK